MTDTPEVTPKKPRRRSWRVWLAAIAGLAICTAILAVILLPRILQSPFGTQRILDVLAPMSAPGKITVERFRFDWNRPVVMEGFRLHDQDGSVVIASEEVQLSRTLWQIVNDPNDMGTLSFRKAVMNIRREADGKINLVRALGSLIDPKAEKDFAIVIADSQLTVHSPEMPEPFVSHDADVEIDLPKAPKPLGFSLTASGEGARKVKFSLAARGQIQRWTDKSVDIVAEFDRWPFVGSGMGLAATAWVTGRIHVTEGPKSFHVVPDIRADLQWQDSEDLPKLLTAIDRFRFRTDLRATYEPTVNVTFDDTKLGLPGLDIGLKGSASDLTGEAATVNIGGEVKVDPAKIGEILANSDMGKVKFAMTPLTFQATGPVDKKALNRLQASIETRVSEIDLDGIQVGDIALNMKWQDGKVAIAPIDTTVNDGRLFVEPTVEMTEDALPARVRLGPNTTLTRLSLSPLISEKVMVYPAPALASATKVDGFISARILDGVIPVTDRNTELSLKGDLAFEDVRFGPGPWLLNLTQSVGLPPPPTFSLDRPVEFEIVRDRVIQHGLSVPIGQLTRLDFSGSVTFDQKLDLLVEVPVTPTLLQNVALFRSFLGTEVFKIPIRGTIGRPEVDQTSFDANMKQLGENLKNRAVDTSLDMLFNGILGGRVPRFIPGSGRNEPPPPPQP